MLMYIGIIAGCCALICVLVLVAMCVLECRFKNELPYIQEWLKARGYILVRTQYGELTHWALMERTYKKSPKIGFVEAIMYHEILRIRRSNNEDTISSKLAVLSKESNREVKRSKIWEK